MYLEPGWNPHAWQGFEVQAPDVSILAVVADSTMLAGGSNRNAGQYNRWNRHQIAWGDGKPMSLERIE